MLWLGFRWLLWISGLHPSVAVIAFGVSIDGLLW
jgi:hypothetical protein